ncbi:MAG: hypothetical protein ACK4EY_09265 [Flavipsychrobacter sp.]
MKHILTAVIFFSVLFTACSKDKTTPSNNNNGNNNQPTLTDEEKFLVGDWVFEKGIDTLRPKNDPQNLKITEGIIPCKMDDVYHLRADKKYTKDEGQENCNPGATNGEKEWSLAYGGITFADGPNPAGFANTFTKINNDRFSILWSSQMTDGHLTRVYYFKRK